MNTVRFYQGSKKLGLASEESGRDIFTDCDMIEIIVPGDNKNVIDREATELDIQRNAALYANYKAGKEDAIIGTPLSEWAHLSKAAVLNYQALGIKTIEQLSELSDGAAQSVGAGAISDKLAATRYLASTNQASMQDIIAKNQSLQAQLDEVRAQLDAPKRGRPKLEE